jgi:hypothetical protein
MSKAGTLQAALSQNSGKSKAAEPPRINVPAAGAVETSRAPSRAGKENVSAWLHGDFQTSLRLIHARTGTKKQELIAEALNDLFAKYDVPQVRED